VFFTLRSRRVRATIASESQGGSALGKAMTDPFVPYTIILDHGLLSPAEDLETAIIAAAQSEASGRSVARIERGGEVILEGEKLRDTIAKRADDIARRR
jgi:hypothetical protein